MVSFPLRAMVHGVPRTFYAACFSPFGRPRRGPLSSGSTSSGRGYVRFITSAAKPPAILRGGELYSVVADVICDVCEDATHLRFRRAGKLAGEVTGRVLAWWLQEDGADGVLHVIELSPRAFMRVHADASRVVFSEPGQVRQFYLHGQLVGLVYDPRYAVWRTEPPQSWS